mmetsp:Transcript_5474/g.7623  ORF Transcript_5474/g.7623 Transcript_5474/m.7623 type:complete len:554 (-) Transcript_5474:383-2044(-)|eukprot:CAMPEP_0184485554 /NCGR_PEP_ID=MMETSP0113_2-20130426/7136_1 /TAXON_ID=91329 /ORGANISM="Norrisiella sphaerica, Strain BC52" /LENGTH=553 /DNA_ID=CAMNT_0026867033 /DNA_START=269 /DNA_END=1930 /DNA_ORIENTATION=+
MRLGSPSHLVKWMLLIALNASAIEIDVSLPFRYRVSLEADNRIFFNLTSPTQFVHIALNASVSVALESLSSVQHQENGGRDGSARVENLAADGRDGRTIISIHDPVVNATGCSESRPCRYVMSVLGVPSDTIIEANVTQGRLIKGSMHPPILQTTPRGKSDYYGIYIRKENLPALVKVARPSKKGQTNPVLNAKLLVFEAISAGATAPLSIRSSSESERHVQINDIWNCKANSGEASTGCLYIAEVFVPKTSYGNLQYEIELVSGETENSEVFPTHLMWMAAAVTILFMCLISAVVVFFRIRADLVQQLLARRSMEEAANVVGGPIAVASGEERGVTATQLKRMKIWRFQSSPTDCGQTGSGDSGAKQGEGEEGSDTQAADELRCSICLADYEDGDPVIDLPCGHDFHGTCVAPWLEAKHRCPLCRQHLDTAEAKMMQQPPLRSTNTVHSRPTIQDATTSGNDEPSSQTGESMANHPRLSHATCSSIHIDVNLLGRGRERDGREVVVEMQQMELERSRGVRLNDNPSSIVDTQPLAQTAPPQPNCDSKEQGCM